MILYQQSEISRQKPREVGANSAKSVPTKSTISVAQVSNTRNLPSTCRKLTVSPRLKKVSLSDSRQKEILPILLQVFSGEKTLDYDEEQISKIDKSRNIEKMHYRDLISFAIQAQIALIHLKTKIVELLALKRANASGVQARDVRLSIRKAIIAFFKAGKCYFSQLDRVNGKEKNVLLDGNLKYQKANARARLKSSKYVLQEKKEEYSRILKQKDFQPQDIDDYIRNSVIEQKYTNLLYKYRVFTSVSLAELQESIKKLFQIAENEVGHFCKPAFIPEELQFKEKRQFLPRNFWELLDAKLEVNEYTTLFHKFLLTNWENEIDYKKKLTQGRIEAAKAKDIRTECMFLLKKCLGKNMAYSAALLIKHALNVKDKQLELEKLIVNETNREIILRKKTNQAFSLDRFKSIIRNDFMENFSYYHEKKTSLPRLSAIELFSLKGILITSHQSAARGLSRAKGAYKSILNDNLEYINQVLHLLRASSDFDDRALISLVKFYLAKENHEQRSTSTQSAEYQVKLKRTHDSTQMSNEPPAKRTAKVMDVAKIESNTTETTDGSSLLPLQSQNIQLARKEIVTSTELNYTQHDTLKLASFSRDISLCGEMQQLPYTILNDTDFQDNRGTINPHLQFPQPASQQDMRSPSSQVSALNFEVIPEFSGSSISFDELAQTDNQIETDDFDFEIDMNISDEDIDLSWFNEFEVEDQSQL